MKMNELSAYTTIHGVRNSARYMCVRLISLLQEMVFIESPNDALKQGPRTPLGYAANPKNAFKGSFPGFSGTRKMSLP